MRRARRLTIICVFFLSAILLGPPLATIASPLQQADPKTGDQEIRALTPGQPIDRELSSGVTHYYRVTLTAGDYLRVEVVESGADVHLALVGPDGQKIAESDNSFSGLESASLIAEVGGAFQVETRLPNKTNSIARYQVRIADLRQATEQDRDRVRAARLFSEGGHLHFQRSPELYLGAKAKYEEALAIYKAVGDRHSEGLALYRLGLLNLLLNDRRKSLECYQQAPPLFEAVADRKAQAWTLVEIGAGLNFLGEKRQSLDILDRALTLLREIGQRSYEAYTLSVISSVLATPGARRQAIAYREQALAIYKSLGDRRGEAISLNAIGINYENMGEKQKALEYMHQALPIFRAEGDGQSEAQVSYMLGMVYNSINERERAVEFFNQALALRKKIGHRGGPALQHNDFGNIYLGLRDYQQALAHYQQSLALFQERKELSDVARILRNIGLTYDEMGEAPKAAEYFKRAAPLFRLGPDRQLYARVMANLGKALSQIGEHEEALKHLNESLAIFRALESHFFELYTLYWIAHAERGRGALAESRARIEEAIEKIERLRGSFYEPELRVAGFTKAQDFYELEIDLLTRLKQRQPDEKLIAAALETSELARARTMLDLLAESRVEIRQGISEELKRREREIQLRLSTIQSQLIQARQQLKPDQSRVASLQEELKRAGAEREELEREIRRRHPRYAEIRYPAPLRAEAIRGLLDEQTAMLEYFLGQENSFLFVVTREKVVSFQLPKADEIGRLTQELREAIKTPGRREFNNFTRASHRLYQTLVAPASDALAGKKRLLIVPDGALHYLPFEALLTKAAEASAEPDYLIKRWAVSYAPSASVLANLRRGASPVADKSAKQFLAFADPVYETGAQNDLAVKKLASNSTPENALAMATRGLFDDASRLDLTPLAQSRREVMEIARRYRPEQVVLFLGREAKEESVKTSSTLANARRIHFATHGLISERKPQYSGLVLTLDDDPREDGLLQVYEIFNLKLQADLVVLSACQTGLGQHLKGEGIIGLTRAFMYAGAPSVVVSLWRVADASTAELMVSFYQYLDRGDDKAEALRRAKLELMRNPRYAHPYFWAPFALVGEAK
jgi:CHAT domain-containing protein/Tfp pilus assembly protein PilF